MIKIRDLLIAAAAAGAVAALAAPSFADPPGDYGPPPDQVEMVPPAPPGPTETWVWRHGHWAWDGAQYIWVRGGFVRAIRPGAVWVSGHWVMRPGGYVWIDGHWR